MIRTLLKPFSFVPALLLMYMIYSFSAQDAQTSSALSYKVSYKAVEIAGTVLDADLQPWEIDSLANRFHGTIRKLAHMSEYFALAVAVAFPLYVYGMHGIWLMLMAGFICVAFSCGDEYHQSFVQGRSPSLRDVGIDSFGVFWGIILVRIIGWTGRKTVFRPRKKKKRRKFRAQEVMNAAVSDDYTDENGEPVNDGYPDGYSGGDAYYAEEPVKKPRKKKAVPGSSDQLSEDMSLGKVLRGIVHKD